MRLRPVSLAAAVVFAALALPGVASAKTGITLSIQTEADGFSGFVKSSKSSCHSGRKVVLYRKVSGPDKKAGSDVAQPNQDGSQWKISVSRDGTYYAKVAATSKCGGKTSKALRSKLVDEGEGASAAQGDEDGTAKIKLLRGTGSSLRSVLVLFYSTDKDCVEGRRITFYRQALSSDDRVIAERKIGYVTAELFRDGSDGGLARTKKQKFKLSRDGRIVAKVAAAEGCAAGRSNVARVSF